MQKFQNNFLNTIPFSDFTVQFTLAFETELTYTIPGDFTSLYRAEFSWPYNANVWVGYNITATLPVIGAMTLKNRVEMNPTTRYVKGGDVLHFISNAVVADAGISFLLLPS